MPRLAMTLLLGTAIVAAPAAPVVAAKAATKTVAYVTDLGRRQVKVIDTASQTVTATVPVGNQPVALTVTPDGSSVFVANGVGDTVSRINTATNTVSATIPVDDPRYIAASPNGSKVFTSSADPNSVVAIDTATNGVATKLVGSAVRDLVVSPDGGTLYVVDRNDAKVLVMHPGTLAVTDTIAVGALPTAIAVSPNGRYLAVTSSDNSAVTVVDTTTGTVVKTITVDTPLDVAYTSDGSRLYIAGYYSGVTIVDTTTNTIVDTIAQPPGTESLAFTPDNTLVYLANFATHSVYVINVATKAVVATLSEFSLPYAVAVATVPVPPSADVGVTITDSADPVTAGEEFTYTATVTNNGPDAASGVTATVRLSGAAHQIKSATSTRGTCAVAADRVDCAVGALADDASATITVTIDPADGGTITANASVDATEADPAATNDNANQSTTVVASADLGVTLADSPDPAALGDTYTYTATVGNKGPSRATGVTGKLALSGAARTIRGATSTRGDCTIAGAEVTCPIGTLAKAATATITVTVEPQAAGTIIAAASADAAEPDPVAGDNTATETTTVTASADLEVTLADSADPVAVGDEYTYTATITNKGRNTATGVTGKVVLSGAARALRSATSSRGDCTVTGAEITCPIGALEKDASATITVALEPEAPGTITATASADATQEDPVAGNNTATETTTIAASADLGVTLVDSADPAALGDTYTYTATVTNKGPSAATAVVARVAFSGAGRTVLAATSSQGTCAVAAAEVTCAVGDLAKAGTETITITVEPLAVGTVTAVATVTAAEQDPVAANNSATATTAVANPHRCTILGTAAGNVLAGTSGNDVICAFGGNDLINAGAGNDIVYAGSGNDSVYAADGNDTVHGGDGNDAVNGENGTDTIDGGPGTDTANGGAGTDTCTNVETRISCP
ncbi:CARDB domain-containing protein [Paractinoplanes deccanensis]|nr:CARDB domain-containing protein [Actinoplanes deccanensis]